MRKSARHPDLVFNVVCGEDLKEHTIRVINRHVRLLDHKGIPLSVLKAKKALQGDTPHCIDFFRHLSTLRPHVFNMKGGARTLIEHIEELRVERRTLNQETPFTHFLFERFLEELAASKANLVAIQSEVYGYKKVHLIERSRGPSIGVFTLAGLAHMWRKKIRTVHVAQDYALDPQQLNGLALGAGSFEGYTRVLMRVPTAIVSHRNYEIKEVILHPPQTSSNGQWWVARDGK